MNSTATPRPSRRVSKPPAQMIESLEARRLLSASVKLFDSPAPYAADLTASALTAPAQPLAATGPAQPAVTYIQSPNFGSRPAGQVIDAIVIHTTESTYTSTINTFLSTASQVSAHYVVNTDGTITQMVDTAKRAWHATYYNDRSIGIENVGYAGQASTWNSQNLPALEKLVAWLAWTYKVPVIHPTDTAYDFADQKLNEKGIVAHGQVQPWNRTDPGPYFPWTQFITDVNKIIADSTTPPPPTQTPYTGSPFAVGSSPVTIQAENFDKGGEGVAYHDVEKSNLGGKYRTAEGVDITTTNDAGGGFNVGFVKSGEWLEYSLDVAKEGGYNLVARVASSGNGGKFHVEINGVNVSQTYTIPNTSGWQKWADVPIFVNLPAGKSVMRIKMDANGSTGSVGNFNYFRVSPATSGGGTQSPYLGTPFQIASTGSTRIEAELFDNGGEGVAYHDLEAANLGGQFRTTGVDVQTTADNTGSAYNVGYTKAGEWIEYSINVATAGAYRLDVRTASGGSNGKFHLEVDGVNATGALTAANTGGWQNWTTLSKAGVNLTAGNHVLRLKMDTNGSTGSVANFNWLALTKA